MKRSTTKNALLMSVLSLFLCFAMLTGTTFAWFTDTVESGVNQIVAGNLDVELTHTNKKVSDETVAGATNLFSDIDAKKWEPNAMAMETFTVKNLGNLALKYKLSLNIDDVTVGKDGTTSFASVLKVAVVSGTIADRAAVEALAESAWMPFEDFAKTGDLMPTENGGTPDVDTWTVIIWWQPSDIDNNFNMNNGATGEMKATFGINLFATQLEAESDSFGSDYDEAAPIISEPVSRPAAGNAVELNAPEIDGGLSVDLPADVVDALPAEVTGISIAATAPVAGTDAVTGEKTLTFSELTVVDQNGKEIDLSNNTTPVTVTLNVKGVYNNGDHVVIYHDDVAIASATVANDTITYTTAHFCEVVVSGSELKPAFVADAAGLKEAIAAGGYYILSADIELDADETITVSKGVILDLNGYTISSKNTRTATHNFLIDVKGGELTVKNGTVSYEHTGANMGWNGATTVIDVTAGGILNLENAVIENKGGTDMNFAVHLNNWGSVTLNADNCVFDAPYCSVRVFNSGPDMNNVTIENSKMTGATRAFWVHNYDSSDMGGKTYSGSSVAYDKAVVDARMNFDVFGNGNTFEITGTAKSPIRYGFTNPEYYSETGAQIVSTSDELVAALANGKDVIFANDITMAAKTTNGYGVTGIVVDGQTIDGNGYTFKVTGAGTTWDSAIYIKGGKIENLNITGAMRGVFMGTANADVYLEKVSFGTIYTFNSDGGNKNFGVYISNSTMNGWTSHSNVHKEVVYTNCVFTEGSGYKYCRPYGPTKFIDCTFTEGFTVDKSQTTELVFENCIFE